MTTTLTITHRLPPDTGDCQVCGLGCCNCKTCLAAKQGRRDVHAKCLPELVRRDKEPFRFYEYKPPAGTGGQPL